MHRFLHRCLISEAFKKTIDVFKNLDILINNAGVLNDAIWEKEIEVNFVSTITKKGN